MTDLDAHDLPDDREECERHPLRAGRKLTRAESDFESDLAFERTRLLEREYLDHEQYEREWRNGTDHQPLPEDRW